MRLRSTFTKDIKKYVSGEVIEKTKGLSDLVDFLRGVISFCEESLYVDKPIETALPLFEILKMVQDLYGDFDYYVKATQVLTALGLLSKEGMMGSRSLLIFLLNSLKSSWTLVRINAYDILINFPDDHPILTDRDFANNVILKTALAFCNNPKAMIAEGAGLLLKLLFKKCLKVLDIIEPSENERDMQLQFGKYVLAMIKDRLQVFHTTLIKEGKTSALLHGLLAFFKNLFADFKITHKELSQKQFDEWRQFFNDLV